MTSGVCWTTRSAQCSDFQAIGCTAGYPGYDHQAMQRGILVSSNFVFLLPCVSMWLRRSKSFAAFSSMDWLYVASRVCVLFLSSMYHACDNADAAVPCYAVCMGNYKALFYSDFVASGIAIHISLCNSWVIDSRMLDQLYNLFALYAFTFFALHVINYDSYSFIVFIVILGSIDVAVRWRLKQLRLYYAWRWALGWIVAIGGMAILLQYSSYVGGGPYSIRHSFWHFAAGLADCAVPWLFTPVNSIVTDKELDAQRLRPNKGEYEPMIEASKTVTKLDSIPDKI